VLHAHAGARQRGIKGAGNMQRRSLILLGSAAVIAMAGALLIKPPAPPAPPVGTGALAFPGLAQRLSNAARIEVRRHDGGLEIIRRGDVWVLPSKGDYPIRQEKLRELLTGLTELRLMEPRTGNPEMFDRLGLEDPMRAGATSTLLRVVDAQGAALVELVIGRRRVRTQGNVPESAYVRRPNENQAWLAEGRIPVDADPQLWLDRDIANLPRERVQRVTIARVGEAPLVLTHTGQPDGKLAITTPADAPPADDVSLDEVARSFEFLTFLDVRRDADAPGEALGETRFEMTDQLAIIARPRKQGEEIWVTLAAEGDDEAARLNARWRGWVYQVGQWKEKAFIPRLEDLRRQEEAPATPTEPPIVPR
jgi:hypothetical protein